MCILHEACAWIIFIFVHTPLTSQHSPTHQPTHQQTPQERHRGRSRYYVGGGGYDANNGSNSGGDCGRPYYVQPWRDRAFGAPLEYRYIRPLPPAIVRAYGQLQSMSFQGLWSEIHRAWMTVDNVLYLWDYHTEESIVQVRACGSCVRGGGFVFLVFGCVIIRTQKPLYLSSPCMSVAWLVSFLDTNQQTQPNPKDRRAGPAAGGRGPRAPEPRRLQGRDQGAWAGGGHFSCICLWMRHDRRSMYILM